jgi:hypothetical protein
VGWFLGLLRMGDEMGRLWCCLVCVVRVCLEFGSCADGWDVLNVGDKVLERWVGVVFKEWVWFSLLRFFSCGCGEVWCGGRGYFSLWVGGVEVLFQCGLWEFDFCYVKHLYLT